LKNEIFFKNKDNAAIRKQVREFSKVIPCASPFAVTLTLKLAHNEGGCRVPLTELGASRNLKLFLNILNRKAFGKSGMSKGKKLCCVAILEDGKLRPHFHLCLQKPDSFSDRDFVELIESAWVRTRFGYTQIDAKPCYDVGGWLNYITKYRTKSDFADSIDWANFHNGDCGV
jgi:hypothetical protein